MFNLLRLSNFAQHLDEAGRAEVVKRLNEAGNGLPGVGDCITGTTLGSSARGALIWRLEFAGEAELRGALQSGAWRETVEPLFAADGPLTAVEHVIYGDGRSGGSAIRGGVYRAALFCANQSPTPERIAQFGDETAAMPRYVNTIRRWRLARPLESQGTRPWTVVWEQEYDDVQGLNGAYLMHPVHWAHVDRWFDPEYPEFLVDSHLCHVYCDFERANRR